MTNNTVYTIGQGENPLRSVATLTYRLSDMLNCCLTCMYVDIAEEDCLMMRILILGTVCRYYLNNLLQSFSQ